MSAAAEVRPALIGHLKDLHLPTVRECYEETARRAERETLSYEQYLLEVITRECEQRRKTRVERLLKDSGRPFNILTGVDTNADQSSQTDRPSVGANGVLTLPAPFTSGTLGRNAGITTGYASFDMRITRVIPIAERLKLNVIAEGFNLLNKFNEAAASPQYTDVNAYGKRSGGSYLSIPTAAYDPRQFQFGLKLVW